MKKALFWFLFPFGCLLILVMTIITSVMWMFIALWDWFDNKMSDFENWCFDRK